MAVLLMGAAAVAQPVPASPAVTPELAADFNGGPAADYVLGPGDMVMVRALHVPEFPETPIRVGEDGFLRLPLVGQIQAAGLTVQALGRRLEEALADYLQEPAVTVQVAEAKSHPVSILGAVQNPGVFQLQGRKRLLEMVSQAGGVLAEAGSTAQISRPRTSPPLPLNDVRISGDFTVAEIDLSDLLEARHPEYNIVLEPGDVVTIPRAKLVYVIGEVRRAGGFVLKDQESMSVLQALALAEGTTPVASTGNARILRRTEPEGAQKEIPVNVKKILSGDAADQEMMAGDILFVPDSMAKNAALRAIESAIQIGTGVVIWRR